MKKLIVRLTDGDHVVSTPTFYATLLMEESGVDPGLGIDLRMRTHIAVVLAALLTDSEPLDTHGDPQRVWRPVEVAKLIPADSVSAIQDVLRDLLTDAFAAEPQAEKRSRKRPTGGQACENS